ncbi:uncharacterized protein LOC134816799 [Bolinopsis microptera]|uniref:uncharacterized protein LOC134816799 n=1 Tax=Bolinopsis microptera TaxID=2820187 RepID=UPI00307A39C2
MQMKSNPSLYEPIKDELLKQQHLIKEEFFPDIYSLIKEEVAKQEAIYTHFYQPSKQDMVEAQPGPVYPPHQAPSPHQTPSPHQAPSPHQTPSPHQAPSPPTFPHHPIQSEKVSSPPTYPQQQIERVPSPIAEKKQSTELVPELAPLVSHQTLPNIGQFHQDYSYIPYGLYSYPSPYIPFPSTSAVGHMSVPAPSIVAANYHPTPLPTHHQPTSSTFSDQTVSTYGKMKRVRTDFTPTHLTVLEETFSKSQYMRGMERDDLARQLKVTPKSVTIWFQNRRARMRAESRQDNFIKHAAETGSSEVGKIPDFR